MNTKSFAIDWDHYTLRSLLDQINEKHELIEGNIPNVPTALICMALQDIGFPGTLCARVQAHPEKSIQRNIYGIRFNGETLNLSGNSFDEILDGRFASQLRQMPEWVTHENRDVDANHMAVLRQLHSERMSKATETVGAWLADLVACDIRDNTVAIDEARVGRRHRI